MMSEQQFILKWHCQEETLLRNLSCFMESDILTDVTLLVESQNVKAHRLVLAMCSAYFFQLFQEMGDTQHPVIVLHNVTIGDIRAVLAFIYRGQCIVAKEQLPSLLSVAKLLKIQGLCDMKVPEKNVQIQSETKSEKSTINHNFNETREHKLPNNNSAALCDNAHKVKTESPARNLSWEKTEALPDTSIRDDDDENGNSPIISLKKSAKELSETCKCFLCGKYLSNQYNLRVHMETHEEAYHACQSCPHVSRSRDALRKHISYRHPEEYHTRKRKKIG